MSESPFKRYKSEQIYFFFNLILSSFSGTKALKKLVYILPHLIAAKSYKMFLK